MIAEGAASFKFWPIWQATIIWVAGPGKIQYGLGPKLGEPSYLRILSVVHNHAASFRVSEGVKGKRNFCSVCCPQCAVHHVGRQVETIQPPPGTCRGCCGREVDRCAAKQVVPHVFELCFRSLILVVCAERRQVGLWVCPVHHQEAVCPQRRAAISDAHKG